LAAEVRFDVARTYVRRLDAVDGAALDALYDEMSAQAIAVVQESAVAGDVMVARSADARYVGQGYAVTVPIPRGRLDAAARAGRAVGEEPESTTGLRPGVTARVVEYANLIAETRPA